MNPQDIIQFLQADRLIVDLEKNPMENAVLMVRNGRILDIVSPDQIGPSTELQGQWSHYPGCTLLPGLIDAHTHTNMPGNGRKGEEVNTEDDDETRLARAKDNLRLTLETGVTTLCDCGGWNSVPFGLKSETESGGLVAPRLLVCGNPITIPQGHCWFMGGEASGAEGVMAVANRLLDQGAGFLKVMTTGGSTLHTDPFKPAFSLGELRAAVEVAHGRNVFVMGHARCTEAIGLAAEANFDIITHCVFCSSDGSPQLDDHVIEILAKNQIWVNPTLHIWRSRLLALQEKAHSQPLTEEEKSLMEQSNRNYAQRMEEIPRLLNAGVRFLAGSDCGWGTYPFGGFALELEAMVGAGISPMQAIQSATADGALALGISRETGSLSRGKEADILVVEGNPLADISALREVRTVFKGGKQVNRQDGQLALKTG